MALINSIRKRTGLVIGVVAGGLLLFLVGSNMNSPGSLFLGSDDNSIGSIDGDKILPDELNDEVRRVAVAQYGGVNNIPEDQRRMVDERAWNNLIFNKAQRPDLVDLGLYVSKEELDDMVAGNNILPTLKQSFIDPTTNQFSKRRLAEYITIFEGSQIPQNMTQQEFERTKAMWRNFKSQLPDQRIQEKYAALLGKSSYVTTAEAERNYKATNTTANLKYVYIPYYTVADSTLNITDEMLNKYLAENAKKYETEGYRSFEYAVFPITPSAADTAERIAELNLLKERFARAKNDTMYLDNASDNPQLPVKTPVAGLPPVLQNGASLDSGYVSDPVVEGSDLVIYKITDVLEDTINSIRASHILVQWDSDSDEDKATAKRKARAILDSIRAGSDFGEMAKRHSKDNRGAGGGSAARGGDLGWFTEGQMVPPFNDACFNKDGIGLVNEVVESSFGYHIIKVTEPKTNASFVVSKISKRVFAGRDTRDSVLENANSFLELVADVETFNAAADTNNFLTKYSSGNVTGMDERLVGMKNGRKVVSWAYNKADEDPVSGVIQMNDACVVAVLTKVVKKGTKDLESVREEVTLKVKNQLVAEQIIGSLDVEKPLDEIAASYGEGAMVKTANAVNLAAGSLEGVGIEPTGLGAAFKLNSGEKSQAIAGDNGVLVFEMMAKTEATPKETYDAEKAGLMQGIATRSSGAAMQALKELTEVEDKRYKNYQYN